MANLIWLTKGGLPPQGLPRIYVACHPEQADTYIKPIADDLVLAENCSVWYDADADANHADPNTVMDLSQMSLFVFPVTKELLRDPNRARDVDLPLALEHHIPILPIMMETGLDEGFACVFGDMQYLDRITEDETAIPYSERLKQRLSEVLIGNKMAERVRGAFIARAFLSYRKKDRAHAQRLMRLLHDHPRGRDVAIWYDEFLVAGENFNESIAASLDESDFFLLAVTPNLLEDPNYVMSTEYPRALESGKHILAASMVDTDEDALHSYYQDLPDVAAVEQEGGKHSLEKPTLEEMVEAALDAVGASTRKATPEQEYLIGVAYMAGIDVEIDRGRGIRLVANAAERGHAEAMSYLGIVYWTGNGVQRNWTTSIEWSRRSADAYEVAYYTEEDRGSREQAANLYQMELTALITRLRLVGRLDEGERACLRLKNLGEEWRTWSDSQESFTALYNALAQLVIIHINQLQLDEAQKYCDQAYKLLVQKKATNPSEEIDEMILGNLMQSASIAMMQMEFQIAFDAFQKALGLAEAFADASYTALHIEKVMWICINLGYIDMTQCRVDNAMEQFKRALTIAEELTVMNPINEELKLTPQGYLVDAMRSSGRQAEALAIANEGLETAKHVRSYTDASSAWSASFALYTATGSSLFELHRWTDCDALGREMLELGDALKGNESAIVDLLTFMGYFFACYAALNQGQVSKASSLWEHMESCLPADWEHAEDVDTLHFGARLTECKGLLERAQGRSDVAAQYYDEMRKTPKGQMEENGLFAQTGLDYGYACLQSCEIALDLDETDKAAALAAEACETFETLVSMGRVAANTRYYCHSLCLVGRVALMSDHAIEALEPLRKAVELGDDLLEWDESEDSWTIVGDCHRQLAECYRNLNDAEQAKEHFKMAAGIAITSEEHAETLRSIYDQAISFRALVPYEPEENGERRKAEKLAEWAEERLREKGSEVKNFRALF